MYQLNCLLSLRVSEMVLIIFCRRIKAVSLLTT